MEYQANIFASYLLMPNIPFYSEVAKLFDEYRMSIESEQGDFITIISHVIYVIATL